ncbi:MAG TPA: rhodanese-like domain-containing protein [Pseudonocardia sp.]|nr:rhodanese-like domain-containing protein [Pseudonocardia sp.]
MTSSQLPTVTVGALPDGAHPVDVREADEWLAGRAPNAVHIPMSELAGRLDELPEDEDPLYVICRSGGRSGRVVAYLVAQGYPAVNVDGGMQAWERAGLPVVSDGPGQPEII